MQKLKIAASVLALTAGALAAQPASAAPTCAPDNGGITLPKGFCAMVAAEGLGYARHAVAAPNGDLYVALRASGGKPGGLVALPLSASPFPNFCCTSKWPSPLESRNATRPPGLPPLARRAT